MPLSAQEDRPLAVLQTEYDEFEDITTVMTGYVPGPDFYVSLFYTCQGKQLCKPEEKPYLAFYQRGRTWKYLENSELIFLLNGQERLNMGQIAHHGEVQTGGDVVEVMGVPVSVSTLKRIVTAETEVAPV